MTIYRAIILWFKWRKTRRTILKAIKGNFKTIYEECEKEAKTFASGNMTTKHYRKILKRSRAKRNIIANNRAADLYDNALKIMYNTNAKLGKIHGEKDIKLKDIENSLKETYKQLKKSLKNK